MRNLCLAGLLGLALLLPAAVGADETINPPPVGGSYTRTANGQVVEVTIVGPGQVDFLEISATRIRGQVTRLDSTSPVQATIRWVNQGQQQTFTPSPGSPPIIFCMESGDVDKRSGGNENN